MVRTPALVLCLLLLLTPSLVSAQFVFHSIEEAGYIPWGLCTADFDTDGDIDICMALYHGDVLVYEQTAPDQFTTHTIGTESGCDVTVYAADIDNDADMDIVGTTGGTSTLVWWENTGDMVFVLYEITEDVSQLLQIVVADLDGDGDTDLGLPQHEPSGDRLLLNDGMAEFTPIFLDTLMGTWGMEAADLDNDSDQDLIASSYGTGTVYWYEQTGFHEYEPHVIGFGVEHAVDLAVADLNNDGKNDIVVGGYEHGSPVVRLINNGDMTFTRHVFQDIQGISHLELADLNNDGYIDIALSISSLGASYYLLNGGNNEFYTFEISDNGGSLAMEAVDMDEDGDLDLVQGRYEGLCWWENTIEPAPAPGTFQAFAPQDDATLTVDDISPLTFDWIDSEPQNAWDIVRYRVELTLLLGDEEFTLVEDGLETTFFTLNIPAWIHRAEWNHTIQCEWNVAAYTTGGETSCTDGPFSFSILPTLDVAGDPETLPESFTLHPVTPNPFNATARVRVDLPASQSLTVEVFDVTGRHIRTLASGILSAGQHQFILESAALASGTYLIRASGEYGLSTVQRAVLLK